MEYVFRIIWNKCYFSSLELFNSQEGGGKLARLYGHYVNSYKYIRKNLECVSLFLTFGHKVRLLEKHNKLDLQKKKKNKIEMLNIP